MESKVNKLRPTMVWLKIIYKKKVNFCTYINIDHIFKLIEFGN
jgi:hypothetical protein